MLNPRLAGRYAKSIFDLSIELNQLEEVYKDMLFLQRVIKSSRDLVALLKSPVISNDKKQAVLDSLTEGKVSKTTASFNRLLVNKTREAFLPEIVNSFIELYKQHKEIHTVKLTTATEISEELKQEIMQKIRTESSRQNIELITEINPSLIGGYVLQMADVLVDASISYDLNAIGKQFLNNDFIYKIR